MYMYSINIKYAVYSASTYMYVLSIELLLLFFKGFWKIIFQAPTIYMFSFLAQFLNTWG